MKFLSFLEIIMENVLKMPTPQKMSYWWGYGSILGLFLVIQVISGFFLACKYVCSFKSIDLMIRDVWMGWLIRLIHAKGASFFFFFIYLHIGRGIYYFKFFNNKLTWFIGVMIYILSMAIAFFGYVLPWGKMSYWGATVITKLVSVMPFMGGLIVKWLWGGFAVSFSTLTRFFAFHFIFPFILIFFIIIHLWFLHIDGSGNPLGMISKNDKMVFFPYFGTKDLLGFMLSFFFFFFMMLIFPFIFMDCDKFMESKPLVTPIHIQPEWYFLPAYAILRSMPNKLGGVMGLGMSMIALFFLPIFQNLKYYCSKSMYNYLTFWVWISMIMVLLFIGAKPVEFPYEFIGQVCTFFYFLFFIRKILMNDMSLW